MVVRELDGTVTTYNGVDVEGDGVERLLTELFTEHWPAVTVGPLVEGAAYEIRFRSEEHTSELQSPDHLVCRLLLEKKNIRQHLAAKSGGLSEPPRSNVRAPIDRQH